MLGFWSKFFSNSDIFFPLYHSMHQTKQIHFCSFFLLCSQRKRDSVNSLSGKLFYCASVTIRDFSLKIKYWKYRLLFSIWPLDVAKHSGSGRNRTCIIKLWFGPGCSPAPIPTVWICGLLSHVLVFVHQCLAVWNQKSPQPPENVFFCNVLILPFKSIYSYWASNLLHTRISGPP